MASPQIIFARVVLPASLAIVCGEARAQAPTDLPPLPDAPITALSPVPTIELPPVATSHCTPGHCTHTTFFSKRRCKRHWQEAFLGFPEEFERPALGALMHAANEAQVRNGEAAAMTLYAFDFVSGTDQLNARGIDKLGEIASRLPMTFHPMIIERSRDAKLDDKRRMAVLEVLATNAFPVPPERVIVGRPIAHGLRGDEAVVIHEGSLYRTMQGGPPVGVDTDASASAGQP